MSITSNLEVLSQVIDLLPGYIFWKDTNFKYLGCNRNFSNLVGLPSPEKIIGKQDDELPWELPGHQAKAFKESDQKTLSGHTVCDQEEILSLPNRTNLTVLVTKNPLYDQDRDLIGILGCARNVVAQDILNKKLMESFRKISSYEMILSTLSTHARIETDPDFKWFRYLRRCL